MILLRSLNNSFCIGQYIIKDVWGQPPDSTAGWSASTSSYVSSCNNQTIIGGYNNFGPGGWARKTYYDLPGHNTVSITWDAYFLDSWDGVSGDTGNYDIYILEVDNTIRYADVYEKNLNSSTDYCGNDEWPDLIKTVTTGTFNHNSTSITLYFRATLNQGHGEDESFGFKNVKITVNVICTPACATCFGNDITECYSCNNGWYLNGSTCVTDCGAGYWNNPSGRVCTGKLS